MGGLNAIRALAGKLGVDLNLVQAAGPGGMVTRADVERAAKRLTDAGPAEPLKGMRRAMAQRMTSAHAEVVPTTVTDDADIGNWPAAEDITIGLVGAIAAACRAEPSLNVWYNSQAGERRLIKRIDIGIAVDTDGGLIVPVLRNVGERDAKDLRAGLDRMRADARARAIPPEELRGATITLSNFRPPDVAGFGAEETHLSAPEVRTNTCPVFWGGHRQPAASAKVLRPSLRTQGCPLSPAPEHPTSLGAALPGGGEYRAQQCALQLADRNG